MKSAELRERLADRFDTDSLLDFLIEYCDYNIDDMLDDLSDRINMNRELFEEEVR